MKEIQVPQYILEQVQEAIRLASNALGSRQKETAMDRQIEYSERLLKWVLEGKAGEPPRYI